MIKSDINYCNNDIWKAEERLLRLYPQKDSDQVLSQEDLDEITLGKIEFQLMQAMDKMP